MLMDSLSQTINKLKQMDMIVNASVDAEKKAKKGSDFRVAVDDYSNTVFKLREVVTTTDFMVTAEAVKYLEESINMLDEVVNEGAINSDVLVNARQQFARKVAPSLAKEWKDYYQKKTKVSLSKLNTLGKLAGSPDKIASIRVNISKGSEWTGLLLADDGVHSRLMLFQSAVDKIDELEEGLDLSDEIKTFIVKVTNKKARLSDITETIVEWIKKENLEDKFFIDFLN